MAHKFRTCLTADEVEAITDHRLIFRTDPMETGRYNPGDSATVTSHDGAVFIGEIDTVEENNLRLSVKLS